MRANTAALAALSMIVAANGAHAQTMDRARPREYRPEPENAPQVSVWIDRFSYRPGQRIRAFFQSDPGAYVTILRVSTAGDVRVLFPRTPARQESYSLDRLVDDEVPYSSSLGFFLNEPEGVGFVFAVASFEPFDYRNVASGGQWSTYQLTRSGYADPYDVVSRFINYTLPTSAEYSTDYIQYQVAGTLYRPRRYADQGYFDDIYDRCNRYYLGRADYYCRQYGYFGNSPYYYPIPIGRFPRGAPAPVASGKKMPALPKKLGAEPLVKEGGIKPQVPQQRSPSGNADLQRAWWNAQKRDAEKNSATATVFRGGVRGDPQSPTPSDFRTSPSQPRIETRREPSQRRAEPSSQPSYDPAPRERRFEPSVIRSEPTIHRSEPVIRSEPVTTGYPVMRSEPVQRSEPIRNDPPPREFHPAPPPPPPPPPPAPVDRGDPPPRTLPPPPPPPPPPSAR